MDVQCLEKLTFLYLENYDPAPKNSLHRNIIIWKCHFQRYSENIESPEKSLFQKQKRKNKRYPEKLWEKDDWHIRFLLNDILRWRILVFSTFFRNVCVQFQISRESDISERHYRGISKTHLGTRSIENSNISIFSRLSSRKIRRDITHSTESRSGA